MEEVKVRRAVGAAEYRRFQAGETDLTRTEAIHAMCYLCTGFYADGKVDCGGDQEGSIKCPLTLFGNPYKDVGEGEIKKPAKIMKKSCARCEYPLNREDGDYTCSLGNPQEDREGRLFPKNEECWQGRRVRGGKGDV